MADQVIYESVGWPDPVRGVLAVAAWASNELNEQIAKMRDQVIDALPVVIGGELEEVVIAPAGVSAQHFEARDFHRSLPRSRR